MTKAQQNVICLQPHLPSPSPSTPKSLPRNGSNTTMKSSLKISRPNLVRCNTEPTRKSVHFSTTNLEDIRPFLKTQSPASVSLKEKLDVVWNIDDSSDEQSDIEEEQPVLTKLPTKPKENEKNWTLLTPGLTPYAMGRISPANRPMVYLDMVQLTPDGKSLKAVTYVRNVCFQKHVALRYTLDSWESFDETAGTWSADIRKYDRDGGFDRFDILIPLENFSEQMLNTRCIQACVRFVANSTEYWDNKGGKNYEFYLRNPRLSNQSVTPVVMTSTQKALPKSRGHPVSSSAPRPRALSTGFIDSHDYDIEEGENYDELSTSDYLKRVGVRMRQPGSPQKDSALFDRYSFAASYNAAPINNSSLDYNKAVVNNDKEAADFKEVPVFDIPVAKVKHLSVKPKQVESNTRNQVATSSQQGAAMKPVANKINQFKVNNAVPTKINTVSSSIVTAATSAVSIPADAATTGSEETSPAELWESDSYKEFVSRYCFFTPNVLEKAISATDGRKQRRPIPDQNDSSSSSSSSSLSSLFNKPEVLPNRT